MEKQYTLSNKQLTFTHWYLGFFYLHGPAVIDVFYLWLYDFVSWNVLIWCAGAELHICQMCLSSCGGINKSSTCLTRSWTNVVTAEQRIIRAFTAARPPSPPIRQKNFDDKKEKWSLSEETKGKNFKNQPILGTGKWKFTPYFCL